MTTASSPPIAPLGIVGGGQLGCMLHQAARALGIPARLADPDPRSPGRRLPGGIATGSWAAAARAAANGARVVTWEREDLDPAHLVALEAPVLPRPSVLASLRDRLGHKQALAACAIPTADWMVARDGGCVDRVLARLALPLMVKARRGGFDGRGQVLVHDPVALAQALDRFTGSGAICEQVIDFDDEFAVLLTRDQSGRCVHYPLVWTHQESGQLAWAAAPHPLSAELAPWARRMIEALAAHLDHVGTLVVECFRCGDRLLVNEIAPRVHNSGHWTIEGCRASQFENHVRAVYGLPLVEPEPRGICLLANCIGEMPAAESCGGAHRHDYHKDARPRRKVGHLTLVADSVDELIDRLSGLPPTVVPDRKLLPWCAMDG